MQVIRDEMNSDESNISMRNVVGQFLVWHLSGQLASIENQLIKIDSPTIKRVQFEYLLSAESYGKL